MADKSTKKELSKADIEARAINIVRQERAALQDSVCFVTDKVAFQMRNLIRNLRKNYWGVYDYPDDPITGRQKVWVPLTRTLVEGVTKNIDLDTKDIYFVSKNPKGYEQTEIIRCLVKEYLDKISFGETLDATERALAIDGTVVWKFIKGVDKDGKPTVIRRDVDLLNVYIDPTEDNIQDAYRFTERSIMTPEEISRMDWLNNDIGELTGSNVISRIDGQYQSITTGVTAKYRDVWEMWGKIPKSLITGNKDDEKTEIDGHIVISGLEVMGPKLHLIEENLKGFKPYEECRYAKVSNRWYGLGIAERTLMLQIWMNTIINIRINRSYVSQLGLFKIRKGSGITPQMLSKLGANGAITVTDVNDIEQMVMQEASQASYTDEQRIMDWAQRDTSAYDIAIGEKTPSAQPATTSVIQNNNAQSTFKMVKNNLGSFLKRGIDRHILPILAKTVSKKDLIRITSEYDNYNKIIDRVVGKLASDELETLYARGVVPTEEQMKKAIDLATKKLSAKDNLFIELERELIAEHVDTKIQITNEEMDISVTVQNVMQMMSVVGQFNPQAVVPLVKEAFDLMGLDMPDITTPQQLQQMPQQQMQMPQQMNQNPQQQATMANTLQRTPQGVV